VVVDIIEQDFDQQVLKSSVPVVVDFWAPRCVACGNISTLLDKLSGEYKNKLKFCKVNVGENPSIASKYYVRSLPTLLFFKRGQPSGQSVGGVSESALRSKLEGLL
jgi:thioredoxin 1